MATLRSLATALTLALASTLPAATITLDADQPADAPPTAVGIFFEDINFNADGGIYAELVKNRSFEFPDALMGWTLVRTDDARGSAVVIQKPEYDPQNPRCLRITIDRPGQGIGLLNEGFRGIGLRADHEYLLTLDARARRPMNLRAELLDDQGELLAHAAIEAIRGRWDHYQLSLRPPRTVSNARLRILATTSGTLDLDMISLFPRDSAFQTDPPTPGFRQDLVDTLAALKPAFLRFPGGCIVEGRTLAQRYQWKNTVGDLRNRDTLINRWNTEFQHRLTPDYFQSFGLGFFEYFLLAEKLDAKPMPIINCGMACQFNTGQTVALDRLQPYIQDALDLIEFANGPTDSQWGRLRADMGHPEPFNLDMLGIGNEQWGPQYVERYKPFAAALNERYPDLKLIAATGSDATIFPNGHAEIEYLWSQWRQLKPDIVDEHFYRNPQWFLDNTDSYDSYDSYDPAGPEIFVGEYAAISHHVASPENRNSLHTALAEAAFMIGMERNARVVTMSSYAPLAGHLDAWQWKPNLIWFDNLNVYPTPNYYVQQLFSLHRGQQTIPATVNSETPLHAAASRTNTEIILKIVNPTPNPTETILKINGRTITSPAQTITLTGQPNAENTPQNPNNITPQPSSLTLNPNNPTLTLQPHSLTIIKIPVQP